MKIKWPLLMSVLLAGCTLMHSPLGSMVQTQHQGVSLTLQPKVIVGRRIQAVVNPLDSTAIASLSIIPTVQNASGSFVPLSANGQPTTFSDPSFMQVSQSGTNLHLNSKIVIDNLNSNATYRILARAYDSGNQQISVDASSSVQVDIANDDRPTIATIPIQLSDIQFAAKTTVTLNNTGGPLYDHVTTTLSSVVNGNAVPVPNTTTETASSSIPATLAVNGLCANTTYRMDLSAYNTSDSVVATGSVNIPVGIDDTPATVSLSFSAPSPMAPIPVNAPRGIAVDSSGNVYVSSGTQFLGLPVGSDSFKVMRDTVGGFGNGSQLYGVNRGTDNIIYAAMMEAQGFLNATTPTAFVGGSMSGAWPHPYAVLKIGSVKYASVPASNSIQLMDNSKTIIASGFNNPTGMAFDASNSIYVADTGNNAIKQFNLTATDSIAVLGSGFNAPKGVAVDASGNVYVADTGNNAIKKIDPLGNVTTLGSGFLAPEGVAVDGSGSVYVADTGNNRIVILK